MAVASEPLPMSASPAYRAAFWRMATLAYSPHRPGHFVLACGLRTYAPAVAHVDSTRGENVVVICGETLEAREETVMGEGFRSEAWSGGGGGGGGGEVGTGSLSRVLNASCLEVCMSEITSFAFSTFCCDLVK